MRLTTNVHARTVVVFLVKTIAALAACSSTAPSIDATDRSEETQRSALALLEMRRDETSLSVYEYNKWNVSNHDDCRAARGEVSDEELDILREHMNDAALEPLLVELGAECPDSSFTAYFEGYERKACWTEGQMAPAVRALETYYLDKLQILAETPRYKCAGFRDE